MQEKLSIEEMEFLHLNDTKIIDFTKDRDITNILAYNKETNELVRTTPENVFENMLQDGARIVITKNTKDGKFIINHKYDATLLVNIDDALKNINKKAPGNCGSSCTSECIDFCSYNCSTSCVGDCTGGCVTSCTNVVAKG